VEEAEENNMKRVLLTMLGIFLISIASAITLYGGENYNFAVNITNPAFTVIDNSSNLEGMNITFNGTDIILSIQVNMKPDNFTLIFLDNITKEVINTVYVSSGHHHHTITKVVNNTIIKIQDVPFYIDNTTNVTVNNTIIKEVPIETNKIPLWVWILMVFETLLIIFLITLTFIFKLNVPRKRTTKEV
jgi:hypothetical protein